MNRRFRGVSRSSGGSGDSAFIRKTYSHLAGGILALVAFDVFLFMSGIAGVIEEMVRDVPWILILGGWVVLAWLASRMAWRLQNPALQYAGLGLYILGKGLILVPLLIRAEARAQGVIEQAAVVTLLGTLGLTVIAFSSKTDFSFLRRFLALGRNRRSDFDRGGLRLRLSLGHLVQCRHGGPRRSLDPL